MNLAITSEMNFQMVLLSQWIRLPFSFVKLCAAALLLALWAVSPAFAQPGPLCAKVDFESLPGGASTDGALINDQYRNQLGITFELESTETEFPQLAEVGRPTTAFAGAYGGDTPAPDQDVGSFFLTDDGELSGLTSPPLIVSFVNPADSASGVVLDIDFDESFTIEARDASENVVEMVKISAGDEGTGDALATPWGFRRDEADVYSIRFVGERDASGAFGLGFDNFVTCVPARLPVELTSFSATPLDASVHLRWTTASEQNNAGFRIERSVNEADFTDVGFVSGAGTTVETQSYRFIDRDLPYTATKLAYRLRQIDTDGSENLSNPVVIGRRIDLIELLEPYPNPATESAWIRFAIPRRMDATLNLYDTLGRVVQTIRNGPMQGRKNVQLDVSGLANGAYLLHLRAGSEFRTKKLIVVK